MGCLFRAHRRTNLVYLGRRGSWCRSTSWVPPRRPCARETSLLEARRTCVGRRRDTFNVTASRPLQFILVNRPSGLAGHMGDVSASPGSSQSSPAQDARSGPAAQRRACCPPRYPPSGIATCCSGSGTAHPRSFSRWTASTRLQRRFFACHRISGVYNVIDSEVGALAVGGFELIVA